MATDKNFVIKNGLTIGTTEVIDSSGNLVNTSGTISGTTITGSDRGTFEDLVLTGDSDDDLTFTVASGDWSILNSQQSNGLIIYDGTAGVKLLYNNSEKLEVLTGGLNVVNGTLSIAGTEFADASRNITAGTIDSGAITSTGASSFADLAIGGAADSNYDLKVYGLARFQGTANFVSSGNVIQIGGTTVIDSSRNLSNIGTIAAGKTVLTGTGSSNTYSGLLKTVNTSSDQWGHITLGGSATNSIINNYYMIGRGSSVSAREMSFHIPNDGNYGDSTQPIFRFASSGSDTLMTITAETGAMYVKGNITVGGTVDGRDVATDGTKLDGIAAGATNTAAPFYTSAITSSDVTTALGYTPYQESTGLSATTGSFTGTVNMDGVLQLDRGSGVDTALEFLDSGGDYSIKHNVNDGNGNYSISIGYKGDGNGQYAVTGDGVGKILFGGHGRDGAISLNAAPTGTASNDISFSIGLLVDGSDNTIRVGASANGTGMDLGATDGTKVFDASANAFATSYSVGSTTVIDSSNFLQNVTLKIGTTGARFQGNGWHYDTNNDARFYFESSNRTFYRADGGHHFRANGDTTRLTISQSGGINLFSNGDTQAGTGEVINVAGTNILDSSRNLTNIGTISSGAISSTGNLDVDGIIDNTRNNGNVSPPSTSDHTAGTRIKFYDASATSFYAIGIESDTMWFNSDVQYKWYQDAVERMTLSDGGNLSVDGTLSLGSDFQAGTSVSAGFYQDSANGAYRAIGTSSTRGFYFQSNAGANTYMYVGLTGTYAGRVGVGTISPAEQFHATGVARVGSLKIDGTTVIDSSRNLTNINLVKFREDVSSFYISPTNANTLNAWYGGDTDTADMWINYRGYNDGFTRFRDFRIGNGKGSALLFVDGSAKSFDFQNDSVLKINGSTFIDASRNLSNIGTINSDNITVANNTSDPTLTFTTTSSAADPVIQMNGQAGITAEGFEIWYDNSVGDVHLHTTYNNDAAAIRFHTKTGATKSTANERFTINGNGNVDIVTGSLRMGTTTVIDSSRNLTNINAGAFGQDVTAMDTTNLDIESVGNVSIRGGSALYFGITTNNFNSWKTRIYSENTSTMQINAQALNFNNIGYGSSTFFLANSTGFDIRTGGLLINQTTVIDSSRNLTNIVNITSSGQFKTNYTTYAPSPDTYVYLSASELQFGGNNNGKEQNSAQISAGQHQPNSLNFVGMSSGTSSSDRRMDFWVEGGGYFRGNVVATGNVTAFGSASDKRLKKDIVKIDNAIDKIKSVTGYEFAWNENAPEDKQDKREFGVIAQEVEEAGLDKLVFEYERPVSGTDEDNKDLPDEKWKAVHYDKFVPILIEAIKEQQKQIEELKEQVSSLTPKN